MNSAPRAGGAARAFSIVLGLLLALGLPLALFASSVANTFFDLQLVRTTVSEYLIRSGDVRQLLIQELIPPTYNSQQEDEISIQSWLVYLEPEDRSAIAQILFPDTWMKDQLDQNVERFYGWLEGDLSAPDLQIDLRPVKQRLLNGASLQMAEIVVASWPICTESELLLLAGAALGIGEPQFIACQPPSPWRAIMVEHMVEGLKTEAIQTSDTVRLEELFRGPGAQEQAADFKRGILRMRSLALAAWLLPASGLGLLLALSVRSWRQLLLWWGAPLLTAGLFGLLLAVLAGSALSDWISAIGEGLESNPLARPLQSAVHDLLEQAINRYARRMLLLGMLGAVMLVWGRWNGRRT